MITGKSKKILPIELASSITECSRSVGRLEIKTKDGEGFVATGFLVHKDLILTAAHVLGDPEQWSTSHYSIDFEFLSKKSGDSHPSLFLDAAPYPWADPAASALLSLVAEAYRTTDARLEVLATAGIPRQHLLQEGTPHAAWRQALDVAASMGLTRAVVDTVLKDDLVAGFHKKIKDLLTSEAPLEARPVAVDRLAGWGALRLDKPTSRAPLALGSASHMKPGDSVVIIQHPLGEFKQFVLAPEAIVQLTQDSLCYTADTSGGSSGAPVFDQSMRVIAVHFRARFELKANEGIRIDLVKTSLRQHGLNFVEAAPMSEPKEQGME